MPSQSERSTSLLMRDLMFAALRVKNARLNALAIELFTSIGEQTVRRLVLEASDRKNPAGFRLTSSEAIARIGPVTDARNFMDLGILADRDRNPKIREAAAALTIPPFFRWRWSIALMPRPKPLRMIALAVGGAIDLCRRNLLARSRGDEESRHSEAIGSVTHRAQPGTSDPIARPGSSASIFDGRLIGNGFGPSTERESSPFRGRHGRTGRTRTTLQDSPGLRRSDPGGFGGGERASQAS